MRLHELDEYDFKHIEEAREQAFRFEELDNLKRGDIDIYEIPETWMFGFKIK